MLEDPRLRTLARAGFVAAVVAFAAWGLRGTGHELADAVAATPVRGLALAAGLVVLGLLTTCGAWLRLLAGYGHPLAPAAGRRVFFVGQLGKYIPGSVWSMGAHADLARGLGVPVRVTVGTSLAFLGLNVATAGLLALGMLAAGMPTLPLPRWTGALGALGCAVTLTPPVVSRLGTLVSGSAGTLRLGWGALGSLVARMALTWTCYAGALVALVPATTAGRAAELLVVAAGGFAAAYVVGVAVVVAPAGVGAREVTLVALLAPAVGLATATAMALVTRVLHTAADLALAALSACATSSRRPCSSSRRTPSGHPRAAPRPPRTRPERSR